MEVILLERIEKLGQLGDVVNVKPGFARNYLLPRSKALRATADNVKAFEGQKAQMEADNLKLRSEAEGIGKKMDGMSINLIRQAGEAGHLYGSVNARDIAVTTTEAGYTVSRTQIVLPHPIKSLGLFDVRVDLHPEVSVSVKVNVARSEEEAETQLKTGSAVVEDLGAEDEIVEEIVEEAAEEDASEEVAEDAGEEASEEA